MFVEDGDYSMEDYCHYSPQGGKKDGGTRQQCLVLQNKSRKEGGDEGRKGLPTNGKRFAFLKLELRK
jgi:hypothetical protein